MLLCVLQEYPVGSKVWLKNMSNTHRMGGKLDNAYLGPYTVAEVMDKGRYQLQNESGKKLKKLYNGVLLKEYFPVKGSVDLQPDVKESIPDVNQPDENSQSSSHTGSDTSSPKKLQQSSTEVCIINLDYCMGEISWRYYTGEDLP